MKSPKTVRAEKYAPSQTQPNTHRTQEMPPTMTGTFTAPLLQLLLPGLVGELGTFGFALTKHARQ